MSFFDILHLALRNLREAKLRAALTTMGVVVGVAVIVTMVSFGLGLQRNAVERFKGLDLFNEITVFGRSVASLASSALNGGAPQRAEGSAQQERGPRFVRPNKDSQRTLDDAAIAEISKIPGVASVEPNISFTAYVRANGRTEMQTIGGALVPNPSSHFKEYASGRMIAAGKEDEAVVDESFVSGFGYGKAAGAVGQTLELLMPREENASPSENRKAMEDKDGDSLSFFGLPLETGTPERNTSATGLAARQFRIVGVLKDEGQTGDNPGGRGFRGLMPAAEIYIPLGEARRWTEEHRNPLSEVALQLARESGTLGANETEGYPSAIVRVTDPALLGDVRKRIGELHFGSFAITDQLEQLRTFFLIINSALGLLGGISLLVASFGIANTMLMSIFERTREIGIMKAIGAEDREIKLIFFVEAAVIGLVGGVVGTLSAWSIDVAANHLAYRFLLRPHGASFVDFFALPPYLWLGAILFAIIVSILAALYPAARAARIDPVKALRHD